MPSDQTYRGPSPFSEPESEAVHRFTSGLHVTVLITNHNFTEDGKWLRQPGFDDVLAVTPDEAAMKRLGDAMAAATGSAPIVIPPTAERIEALLANPLAALSVRDGAMENLVTDEVAPLLMLPIGLALRQ